MNIEVRIAEKAERINKVIDAYLPAEDGMQKTIFEAMNYSLLAGGKRIRPMLMEETYQMFGGRGEVIKPFMAAMEMIHTYSLVHDDLPAMDNDEYRRGKKTTHAVYGEAMGILAGDGLLNYAFETALMAFDVQPENPSIGKALQILARKAGVYGMIGGQVVDIESEEMPVTDMTRERLDFIYRLKTAALLESSMMIGAVLAGASDIEVAKIEQIATKIGLAFQIQDDILDVTGDEAVLGKPVGSDEKNHKQTYVSLKGVEQSAKEVKELSEEAISIMKSCPGDSSFLCSLIEYLIYRNK